MKDIFDFKRFGNYFLYDLRNAWNNYGPTFLLTIGTPVLFYFIKLITHLLFLNGFDGFDVRELQWTALLTSVAISILFFPAKCFGQITDRKGGSEWLMIPASGLEKTLSMAVLSCVVLPVAFFAGFLAVDWIMSVVAPNYNYSLISLLGDIQLNEEVFNGFKINFAGISYLSWVTNMLIFLLGAICFKKSKIAKTILAIFAGCIVLSILACVATGQTAINIDLDTLADLDAERVARKIDLFINVLDSSFIVIMLAAIFARVKTIKH